jgi:signal transduction histidine kinase/ActR/RegA family two-component response regulator
VKQTTNGTPTATLLINPGEKREFEASIARILHHEKAADCMLTLRDVTERESVVRAREAFEARTAQAKSMEALGRLAGGVAHDFNNMLTVISGTVELLLTHSRSGGLSEMQRLELTNIFDAAARAAALTSQLLAFGRKQMLQPRVVSPRETLTSLFPMLQRLVREDIQLVIDVEPDLGNIRVDETRLEQVIMNLVTNGCEAMSRGGKLSIDVKNCTLVPGTEPEGITGVLGGLAPLHGGSGPHVSLSVRDTGEGLTEDARNRMFEPFFTTKAGCGGTGLGLATVHGIVAQSAGHITVESALGQGTCVSVFFPRVDAAVSQQQVNQVQRRRSGKARALLIEDEGNVRWSTRQLLETLHLEVEEACRGSEALEKYGARVQSFDVLICDVIMPGMNGVEVAREFTRRHPSLKVLLISGYAKDAVEEISELGPGVLFLPKPFSRAALDETLNELLAQ